jgi:hypothetical protein
MGSNGNAYYCLHFLAPDEAQLNIYTNKPNDGKVLTPVKKLFCFQTFKNS